MKQLSPISTRPQRHCGNKSSHLIESVYKNDIDGVRSALQENVMAWNTKNDRGTTPLMEASILNRIEILEVLLSSKCDVNATDVDGNTALHLAVDEGNTEVVRKLVLCERCIIDASNEKGETALLKASFYDYADMVRILLKEGSANPDVKDKTGQNALMVALREGSQATVDLLLKHGCDATFTDILGHSALYLAIHSPCNKTLDLAKKLVASGYFNESDKGWLLNDEKHNLFYQDDEFYVDLRKRHRSSHVDPSGRKDSTGSFTQRIHSPSRSPSLSPRRLSPIPSVISPKQVSPTSPPFAMSPRLKQKIMSPELHTFPAFSFSKDKQTEGSVQTSPGSSRRAEFQKAASFEQMRPRTALRPPLTSSFSSDSEESPNASPALRRRFDFFNTKQSASPLLSQSNSVKGSSSQSKQVVCIKDVRDIQAECKITTCNSAPNSPLITYKRQVSSQIQRTGSQESIPQRKTSLPAKTCVQFNTQIQVIEYCSRL